jgi:hypothetical protein
MADGVSNLIAFYRGTAPDAAGRHIAEIWAWDDRRLEMQHDYIQWLFPLPEASRFNPDAPQLTAADAALFRGDADLQAALSRSRDMMLRFYGLAFDGRPVTRAADFPARAADWVTSLNHNHLRLTRILLSLGYLGQGPVAQALLACLLDIADREGREAVTARTRAFWEDAVRAPPPLR